MKDTAEFLLEIGCEEIPAGQIPRASRELQEILEKHFSAHRLLDTSRVETFAAPRRLVATTNALREKQDDVIQEVMGPPKSAAYNNVGQPTKAAQSFAEKQGVAVGELSLTSTPKGEYLVVRKTLRGRAAREILSEILPRAILEISFPRSMYWTSASGARFSRPIRWIVCLLDGAVVPFELAGVHSGNKTRGHRSLGKAAISVARAADYFEKLRKNYVLCRPEERRAKIEREIQAIAAKRGSRAHDDASLLETVVNLNEYPTVLMGDFDPAFLELPEEILVTVMRDHQKYFAVESRSGKLQPHFLAVINLDRDSKGLVRAGHERVLRARFADARFFWATDQKTPLAERLPRLAQVTYESRLGSYRDKVERMRTIARWLAENWFSSGYRQADVAAADRTAELSKCDLVTEMVREFPELQGIVGGLYARVQGESEDVAGGVYDHYRPLGLDEPIPRSLTGCIVSLADKLDSIAACFAAGAVPTGSSDPFALRRSALGIVKILLELKLPISLSALIATAARALRENPPKLEAKESLQNQVLLFLIERIRFVLRERVGFSYDEINAALAAGGDELVDLVKRLEALKTIRHTRNFEPLAISFKRIRNILEKANAAARGLGKPDAGLYQEPAEKELHQAAQKVAERVREYKKHARYKEALEAISTLRPTVDRFFDEVLVMAEDEAVRKNRLALLAELLKEFSTIADFSEMGAAEVK